MFCSGFEEGNKDIWDDYDGNPDEWKYYSGGKLARAMLGDHASRPILTATRWRSCCSSSTASASLCAW